MYLQLEDNGNLNSGFLRGLTAVATGGASELVRGATKGNVAPPPCACVVEKNIIQKLTKKLRQCKKDTGWDSKNRKIIYNPNTGIAKIIESNPSIGIADSAIGSIIGATPYGAAAKGVLDIGKSLFGKKTSTTGATSQDSEKIKTLTAENENQKKQIAKLQKNNNSLKMQRYYFGGGGAVLGFTAGKLIK